ncbi:Gfo/Idh/MocA family protein [Algirhabdus cladophorae]|uniref:Gfo/Idh/MocA family protein n=1 Tax=Algirhabdus cladophorae TaxID=3377108 RepID=UPI003B848AE9
MKAVLIGAGMVADMHAQAIAATQGAVTLGGIWARDPQKARTFAADHGDLRCYADLDKVALDPSVGFCIVLTPPDARLDIARALAEAGKPVLLEKPIERNASAAAQIVDIFAKKNLPLGVVLQHRMRPAARHLKALLERGALGQIAAVDVRVPWWRDQGYYDVAGRGTYARDGGGVLITQAIHTLDLMLHLAGPVAQVTAMATTTPLHQMEAEDFVSAGLRFANGAMGSVVASTASFPGGAEGITLHGTQGSAVLDAADLKLYWRSGEVEHLAGAADTGGGADPMAFGPEWHRDVIAGFARAVAAGQEPPISGGDALSVHQLIDTIILAAKTGQKQEMPHG